MGTQKYSKLSLVKKKKKKRVKRLGGIVAAGGEDWVITRLQLRWYVLGLFPRLLSIAHCRIGCVSKRSYFKSVACFKTFCGGKKERLWVNAFWKIQCETAGFPGLPLYSLHATRPYAACLTTCEAEALCNAARSPKGPAVHLNLTWVALKVLKQKLL